MKTLVLDANILIRAVLGSKVLLLLRKDSEQIDSLTPDSAYQEAHEHLPGILAIRHIPIAPAMDILALIPTLVQIIDVQTYSRHETTAREGIVRRDEEDWPILATTLAFKCPIWTEDTDLFGCGVATWTTDRVELFLARAPECEP